MSALQELIEPGARLIAQVILNSLWQGTVIAFLAWGLMRATRRTNAATRYAIWWAVLIVILVTSRRWGSTTSR